MAHLVTKLASQKRWEQQEVLPDAEQRSEQEGAELAWGGNGVGEVVGAEAPSHVDGWLSPGWGHAVWDEPQAGTLHGWAFGAAPGHSTPQSASAEHSSIAPKTTGKIS